MSSFTVIKIFILGTIIGLQNILRKWNENYIGSKMYILRPIV